MEGERASGEDDKKDERGSGKRTRLFLRTHYCASSSRLIGAPTFRRAHVRVLKLTSPNTPSSFVNAKCFLVYVHHPDALT